GEWMPRPIQAMIDMQALSHNLEIVRGQLAREASGQASRIWAVVKGRAYGHGLAFAVPAFSRADGLALLDLDEAVRCRALGWTRPLLLLEGFFEPDDLVPVDRHRLTLTVHTEAQLDMLSAYRPRHPIDAYLKLNTGMHRLGFQPGQFRAAFQRARQLQ